MKHKAWIRILIFVLSFQLEVRVKASESGHQNESHSKKIESKSSSQTNDQTHSNEKSDIDFIGNFSPENCFLGEEACAIDIKKGTMHMKNGGVALHASAGSFLLRQSAREWTWVKGNLWVEKGPVRLKTVYADLRIDGVGGAFIIPDKKEDKIWVRATNGDLIVRMRNNKELSVPDGFQVWIGKNHGAEISSFGMPEVIPWEDFVLNWGPLFSGDLAEFKAALLSQKNKWNDLAERGAELYSEVVNRQIASEKDEEAKRVQMKIKKEREKSLLKERFKKKALGELE